MKRKVTNSREQIKISSNQQPESQPNYPARRLLAGLTLGMAAVAGVSVAKSAISTVEQVFRSGTTPNINQYPIKRVEVTNVFPDNTFAGIIASVDGTNLSGQQYYDLLTDLEHQNHGSDTIYAGQWFNVPVIYQSHSSANNSGSKK